MDTRRTFLKKVAAGAAAIAVPAGVSGGDVLVSEVTGVLPISSSTGTVNELLRAVYLPSIRDQLKRDDVLLNMLPGDDGLRGG